MSPQPQFEEPIVFDIVTTFCQLFGTIFIWVVIFSVGIYWYAKYQSKENK